jgi:ubiquinone/menaquinone biosynthesis C-methylase UbiE
MLHDNRGAQVVCELSMKHQTIYKNLARYYDLIYSWKDYKKETEIVHRLVSKYKKSKGNHLLEVACGTGGHARYLSRYFEVVATDISSDMLRVARNNVKGVVFQQADMTTLSLDREFDVIVCLFSSIGYLKTLTNLKTTLQNFARHLKQGGVLIIEPWLTKAVYRVGYPHMTTYGDNDIQIARLCVSKVRGDISVMDMHYLVAERNKQVRHFVDRHELRMIDPTKMLELMRGAGFQAVFARKGLMKDRGLYIGIKK